MSVLTLSDLYIYPVKSAAGIAVQQAQLTARGLQYDRRWMVVDARGKFMTQRQFPQMALIGVSIDEGASCLRLSALGMPDLPVWVGLDSGVRNEPFDRVDVEVWGDRTTAIAVGPKSQQWLTEFIGIDCQLVYMPDNCNRPTAHGQFGSDNLVSFADGYPYLLISEASLTGLNQKLIAQEREPVTMQRFRPNFVISGVKTPHDEDAWQQVQVGATVFDLPKLCDRCSIPNVNPTTGDRGKEPTKTLATYRAWDKGIWFGQNCVVQSPSNLDAKTLHVGDTVEVLRRKV